MAKKVRRKLEEEEAAAFEFPVFDESAFVTKEFELTYALSLTGIFAAVFGVLGWVLTVVGVPWEAAFPGGLVLIVVSLFVLRRLRPRSMTYTKGDWAGLFALEFFGWLALWFVLVNLSPGAI